MGRHQKTKARQLFLQGLLLLLCCQSFTARLSAPSLALEQNRSLIPALPPPQHPQAPQAAAITPRMSPLRAARTPCSVKNPSSSVRCGFGGFPRLSSND